MRHQHLYIAALQNKHFRLASVPAAVMRVFLAGFLCAQASPLCAETLQTAAVEFDEQFLVGTGAQKMDISRFNRGNIAMPGKYRAAMYVNRVWSGLVDVTLIEVDGDKHDVQPAFGRDLIERMPVDFSRLTTEAIEKIGALGQNGTLLLPTLIDGARATFDIGELRLDVSIPQAALSRSARGWVDPKFWDDGIPAAILQYDANIYHSTGSGLSDTQSYLGVTAGVNVGPWRLRYNGNVTNSTGNGTEFQHMQVYAQRSFASLKSQLTLGDSYTDGNIFDAFGVRGIQIGSDDRMYPESLRGYAPTVRGIANTNAKVQVRQNGNIIYETTVAPGPFEISDLYATGYGGDLQLIVTEADGSRRISNIPYAAPVNALREGRWRYGVSAGQYRNAGIEETPFVLQATVQHGLSNLLTLYGGAIVSENYQSGAAGVALNTVIGAIGFDATHAMTKLCSQPDRHGQSYRLSFSRLFSPTDTNITLAAYRYSTIGFLSLRDAMYVRDREKRNASFDGHVGQKGRLQATLSQGIGRWGSFYLSGYTQNYWSRPGRDSSYQFGYNTSIRRVGVNFSATRELDADSGRWDNRVMLTLNIPLGSGSDIVNSSTSYTHDSRNGSNQVQESLTGAFGKDYEFNYGVTASYADNSSGNSSSVNANIGYLSPFTQVRANAGHGNGYTQVGGGLSGSVVAWQGGVAFTSQTGDTFAVIEAKDAAGARVASAPGVRVDSFGHALVAGVNPYEMNRVEIDTKGLPLGVELKSTEQRFAPTAGAVVKVNFETQDRGRPVMLRIRQANGKAVPFGADVLDADGNNVGSVTQGGRALVYAKTRSGRLSVKWGEAAGQSCHVNYVAPPSEGRQGASFSFSEAECG